MHDTTSHNLLALYTQFATLKLLPRTGWLQRGVHNAESVAEHTFGVATLALLIGDTVEGLDRGKLLAIAMLHDLAEALLSDLPAGSSLVVRALPAAAGASYATLGADLEAALAAARRPRRQR